MATTISLVVGGDFIGDVSTLDLTGYNAGFNVAQGGFLQNLEGGEETLALRARRSTQALVAADLVSLAATYIEKCRLQNQTAERYQVFLRAKADGETNPRQALLTYLEWAGKLAAFDYMFRVNKNLSEVMLIMTRGRWESTTAATTTLSNISGLGGHTSVGTAVGDFPGRIGYTMLMPHAASGALTEYWWGFRTARFGTIANFVSPWECELGSALTDTAVATDATASPGGGGNTKLTCTFATNTAMVARFTLTPYQISNANYEDLRGTFNIIARIKCGTGITARVRLLHGFSAATSTINDSVIVTGTDWKLYDLGRITFPSGGQVSSAYSAMKYSQIRFQAERTAGSNAGGVQVDCFIPIPVNEGYAHISGGTGVKNELLVNPLNKITCFDYTSTDITGMANTTGTNQADYVLPLGAGIIVVAAQRAASSVLADAVDVTLKAFARWRTLIGASAVIVDMTFDFASDEEGWVYASLGGTGAWNSGYLDIANYGSWSYTVSGWKAAIGSSFTADLTVTGNILTLIIWYSDNTYDTITTLVSGTFAITVGAGGNGKTVSYFGVLGYPTSGGTIDNVVLHGFASA